MASSQTPEKSACHEKSFWRNPKAGKNVLPVILIDAAATETDVPSAAAVQAIETDVADLPADLETAAETDDNPFF